MEHLMSHRVQTEEQKRKIKEVTDGKGSKEAAEWLRKLRKKREEAGKWAREEREERERSRN